MNEFRERDVRFKCLTMDIDTGTASGRLLYNIFASLAEYVHDLIVENTKAGLAASRARGVKPGRAKGMSEKAKITAVSAATLYMAGNQSVRAIAAQLKISTRTLYKYLDYRGIEVNQKVLSPTGQSDKL